MTHPFLDQILAALSDSGNEPDRPAIMVKGSGGLPAWFDVTGLAVDSFAAAGLAIARLSALQGNKAPRIAIDRRHASRWFGFAIRPIGWEMPPAWDAIAGDYRTADGWIRLHTNAAHHRAAALRVLETIAEPGHVATAVGQWQADDLEAAIVAAGGCAAAMRDLHAWQHHRHGAQVAREPLIAWKNQGKTRPLVLTGPASRPLQGIKVLDLTRVLAGPVAGRFLAAYGADVLRIDPPEWEEDSIVPEMTLGKRCAGLDLNQADARVQFEHLLRQADILLNGYRADALARLGYDEQAIRRINPSLIDVRLNAYGWTGPWQNRRGFDSLVQMSSGIADFGMRLTKSGRPTPLPVQALDMATGYLLAAAAGHAIYERVTSGTALSARLSLARTAHLLAASKRCDIGEPLPPETSDEQDPTIENTAWGQARRIRFPLTIAGAPHRWEHPASKLRSSPASW